MKYYPYIIIGGGMTAAAAMAGIREVDGSGAIGIFSKEKNRSYDRPPLTKSLWTKDKEIESIMREIPDGVEFHLDTSIRSINPAKKSITDAQGETYTFDKLLLATGGRPRQLSFNNDAIIYYRTLADYQQLRELSDQRSKIVVIGNGFIGSELAAALTMQGNLVFMSFPGKAICSKLFPADLAAHLNQYYRSKGVEVLAETKVTAVGGKGTELTVQLDDGRQLEVNGVVAGIGIEPNVDLAKAAGLKVDDGIIVDHTLRTSQPDIYAAGDVARFEDQVLGKVRRVEHEDNANTMGEAAGRSMAGAEVDYDYSPMFYSDLFDLGYEAVGQLDSRLNVVVDWQEPYQKGVLYYLSDDRQIRGVLLWNVWDQVDAARELIGAGKQFSPESLAGRIR
jgi:NADPH-dependent 2,4-dienoyl-CoA reductase/sulfur reductase-like enzyme